MTTLTASQTRIPPETFDQVVYRDEVVQITHRGGKCVYVVSQNDWALLQAAKAAHAQTVDEAGDRAVTRFDELLHRLAQ